jgi:hypothetical protein
MNPAMAGLIMPLDQPIILSSSIASLREKAGARTVGLAVAAGALLNWQLVASCFANLLNRRVADTDVLGDGAVGQPEVRSAR